MLQQTVITRRISFTFSSWNEDVSGRSRGFDDSDNFEKNNTSIYVTNGVGSRFFGNFNTNAGSYAVKFETRINGTLAQ
jgi:hypothetical protein